MKTLFRLSIAAALIVALFAALPGARAALVSYSSGFQVQNLEDSTATIQMIFYDRVTGTAALTVNDTIAASSSTTYFPLENINVPDAFDGSLVINSDKEIAAIANILGSNGTDPLAYGASYSGFKSGAPTINLPLLMKGNYGFSTWFSVQNASGTETAVTVTYSDGTTAGPVTVKPGAAAKFENDAESHAAGWVGSGVVSSNPSTNLAVTSLEVGPTTLFAYNGFGSGSQNPVMPLVQANNYGYVTGIQVQNTGDTETQVTMQFTPSSAGTTCTEIRKVPAKKSVTFALYSLTGLADPNPGSLVSENCPGGSATFIGSSNITANSAGTNLVAIVNQLNSGANKGAAYNGFDPASGTAKVVLPLIMDRNYGYFTGFSIVNVGSSTVSGVKCVVTGKDKGGTTVTKTLTAPDLAASKAWTVVTTLGQTPIADGFVGSATCTGPVDSKLVAVVNELGGSSGDAFLVYEGTNTAP